MPLCDVVAVLFPPAASIVIYNQIEITRGSFAFVLGIRLPDFLLLVLWGHLIPLLLLSFLLSHITREPINEFFDFLTLGLAIAFIVLCLFPPLGWL